MGLDKRMKNRIEQIDKNLDAIVKNPYQKEKIEKKPSRFPSWARWAMPLSGALLTCSLALGIVLPVALKGNNEQGPSGSVGYDAVDSRGSTLGDKSNNSKESAPRASSDDDHGNPNVYGEYEDGTYTKENLNCLAAPNRQTVKSVVNRTMSSATYASYKAFAKKFVTLAMNTNNPVSQEKSLAVSIPDAYLCLAITGIISNQNCLQDVLDYLELGSEQALKDAASEIVATLGTMTKDQFGNDVGGLNLNSIWLNPQKVSLLEQRDAELYQDLKNIFDASIYLEGLTSNRAKQYIAENGLPGKPIPDIKLSKDADPAALSVMSTYYNIDVFGPDQEMYEDQFRGGAHTMDYTFGGHTKKVDYIERSSLYSCVYENEDFYGASMSLSKSDIKFFLPKSETMMPSAIFEDVLDEDYAPMAITYTEEGQELSTTSYTVDISAPYFFMKNDVKLKQASLCPILPHLTSTGAGSRLVSEELFLESIEQFSVMRFDYNGFYSCSATVATMEGAVQPGLATSFVLDHPFVFETCRDISVSGVERSIPTVIGEIVDPNYLV